MKKKIKCYIHIIIYFFIDQCLMYHYKNLVWQEKPFVQVNQNNDLSNSLSSNCQIYEEEVFRIDIFNMLESPTEKMEYFALSKIHLKFLDEQTRKYIINEAAKKLNDEKDLNLSSLCLALISYYPFNINDF